MQYPIASTGWFLVIVVNARKESRQRLLQLLTHSNILPLDIQYIYGQDLCTYDMFDYLPHIDLQNPESIGDQFSSYFGVSHTPDSDRHLTHLYTGSATQITNRSLIGEAGRLRYGHMKVLELGYAEIYQWRRSPPGSKWKAELWIHEKMTYPGV